MKKVAKKVEGKKAVIKTAKKVESARIVSGKVIKTVAKIKAFDSKNAGSWDKLGQVSRKVLVDGLGLNKALKNYLDIAKDELTDTQIACLTFANCVDFIKTSVKYKDLQYFTTNDLKLIAQKVLVKFDANTARALKVEKQGGTVGKKAKKLTKVNSSK